MASNVTASGQAFQGFIVPESGLSFAYSGTTANLEWAAPTVASGTADGFLPVPSGVPDLASGDEVYLYPVRAGAPGPDGCAYMWSEAATYSAAVSAGLWRGWDSPTMLRYSYGLSGTGVLVDGPCVVAKSDGTAAAFWSSDAGSTVSLGYATFNGTTWTIQSALDSRPDSGGVAGAYWPAAVALPDDTVVIFYLTSDVTNTVQVTMLSTGGMGANRVLPSALSVPYGITGMRAAYSQGQIVLFITQLDVSSSPTVSQYASGDGGQSFSLVETWTASRHLVSVAATPTGFVALLDREVSAGSWRPEVRRLGSAYSPLSGASATALFDGDRAGSGPDSAMLLAYDPVGALHVLRQASDPTADAPNQAVSIDGGVSWKEYGGGVRSAVGNRGWYAGRVERIMASGHACWAGDRMIAIVKDNGGTSGTTCALHYGGAAMRPMPAGCWDQGESAPTYIGRMGWSLSYLPLGAEPPGDVGWTTTDSGTIARTYGYSAGASPNLTETFDATDTTEHRHTMDNDGGEVVVRAVITGNGDAEVRVLAVSDGTAKYRIEVRYDTGSGVWSWRDPGAGSSWTTLGTSSAATDAHEVIVSASSLSGKGYALVRKWADSHSFDGANVFTTGVVTLTSASTSGDSGAYYIVDTVSTGSVVNLYALDCAFTSLTAAFTASSALPGFAGRPLSSEVATYIGAGLSLQATDALLRGSARLSCAPASSTGAPNLDPVSVPTPQRYFGTNDSGYTSTITITRTETYRTGWDSDLYGLHFEGIDGFESLSIELYDDNAAAWRSLGTFFASSESLNWSRRGTTFAPRESSSAGNALWLDRNELVNGSLRIGSDFAYPIAENSSGTWVAGSTIAERRPFVRIDTGGEYDELTGYATSGTGAYIRYPSMTVLFQPAVVAAAVSGLVTGFSQVRITVAVNGASTDGAPWTGSSPSRIIRKVAMGPVVVMPRELTRAQALTEEPRTERVTYPDGDITVTRRGPRSSRIELAYNHSHAPMRYDRWGAAATAPGYLQASGSGARPLATAEDVVGVLRGLWTDADDGAKPLVWVPYIASSASTWTLTGQGAGVYGLVSGSYQRRNAVGRPNFAAEGTVEAFTFERLTWERE